MFYSSWYTPLPLHRATDCSMVRAGITETNVCNYFECGLVSVVLNFESGVMRRIYVAIFVSPANLHRGRERAD